MRRRLAAGLAGVRAHPGPVLWTVALAAALLFLAFMPVHLLAQFGDDVLIPVTFWSAVFFGAYYTLLARWWGNPMGRMLVGLDLALALVLLDDVLTSEFGISLPGSAELRIIVAALLLSAVIIVSRIILLGRLHGWWPRWPWRLRGRRPGKDAGR